MLLAISDCTAQTDAPPAGETDMRRSAKVIWALLIGLNLTIVGAIMVVIVRSVAGRSIETGGQIFFLKDLLAIIFGFGWLWGVHPAVRLIKIT